MTVTIASLEMDGGIWDRRWNRTDAEVDGVPAHSRVYTYSANVTPLKVDVDGKLAVLSDAELKQLELIGFDGSLEAVVTHADDANGGSPGASIIGQEQLQQLSGLYQALATRWLGYVLTVSEPPA